jgi:hypothetical protein
LVDATVPAQLFVELLKYRDGGEANNKGRDHDLLRYLIRHFYDSSSQICQDLWVLFMTAGIKDGFFVEFGATNGITLSNTYLLERNFGWKGILAEPARGWHRVLGKVKMLRRQQRPIILECAYEKSDFYRAQT